MIAPIRTPTMPSQAQACRFCSLAVGFRVTQTVNGGTGIHGMLPKGLPFDRMGTGIAGT